MPAFKHKLPGATISAGLDFRETEEFWARVERCARPLADDERNVLRRICDGFYSRIQFERNAPDVEDAEKHLRRLKRAAAEFAEALMHRRESDAMIEATQHVEYLLDTKLEGETFLNVYLGPRKFEDDEVFRVVRAGRGMLDQIDPAQDQMVPFDLVTARLRAMSLSQLHSIMGAFLWACGAVERQLGEYRNAEFYRPGEAWEKLVEHLAGFYAGLGIGFRVTAAKFNKDVGRPSAFVLFVSEVQSHFPREFQYHTQSLGALSSAISKVLTAIKKSDRGHRP